MPDLKKQLGQRIKTIRKQQQLTQETLAEMIGIEIPSLSNIETGKFAPSVETLEKLAAALQIEPYELYRFTSLTHGEMVAAVLKILQNDKEATEIVYNLCLSLQYRNKR